MLIRTDKLPWALNPKLQAILQDEVAKAGIPEDSGAVINFRDPDFSADTGGFHPVEVAITHDGQVLYMTDFTYYGRPPHCELAKELDFDFAIGLFQHFGIEYPITQGHEMFKVFQSNFLAFFQMDAYTVTVEAL